jgi:SAM-dependent methyltransferase
MGWDSLIVRLAYRGSDWSDPGEQAAIAELQDELPQSRVLDLGVGAGRTTSFLAEKAASYVGLDITEAMVSDARRRFPGTDLRVGDARRLDDFGGGSFDLVVFSHNGIDCLAHDEREPFLRDCHRLLAPGGALLFSTHNLDGPSYGEQPSLRDARERLRRPGLANKVEAVASFAPRLLLARRNYRGRSVPEPSGPGWACAPLRTHEFRFVVHFARLSQVHAAVTRAGLVVEAVWTRGGERLPLGAETYDDHYAHLLCRRPVSS